MGLVTSLRTIKFSVKVHYDWRDLSMGLTYKSLHQPRLCSHDRRISNLHQKAEDLGHLITNLIPRIAEASVSLIVDDHQQENVTRVSSLSVSDKTSGRRAMIPYIRGLS